MEGKKENRKKGRLHCIYKKCKSYVSCDRTKVSYFRVPKDDARCREWLQACGRHDLIHQNFDASKAYNIYRVCSLHFALDMFNQCGLTRSRLLPSATPEVYQERENSLTNDCDEPGPGSKCQILQDIKTETLSDNEMPLEKCSVETQTSELYIANVFHCDEPEPGSKFQRLHDVKIETLPDYEMPLEKCSVETQTSELYIANVFHCDEPEPDSKCQILQDVKIETLSDNEMPLEQCSVETQTSEDLFGCPKDVLEIQLNEVQNRILS